MSPRSADEIRRDLDRIEAFGPGQHIPDETRRLVADVEPLLAEVERRRAEHNAAMDAAVDRARESAESELASLQSGIQAVRTLADSWYNVNDEMRYAAIQVRAALAATAESVR